MKSNTFSHPTKSLEGPITPFQTAVECTSAAQPRQARERRHARASSSVIVFSLLTMAVACSSAPDESTETPTPSEPISEEVVRELEVEASPSAEEEFGIVTWRVSAEDESVLVVGFDASNQELVRVSLASDEESGVTTVVFDGALGNGTLRVADGTVLENSLAPGHARVAELLGEDAAVARVPYGEVFDCLMNSLGAVLTGVGCISSAYCCAESVGFFPPCCASILYSCGAGLAYSVGQAIMSCKAAFACKNPFTACDPWVDKCCSQSVCVYDPISYTGYACKF